MGDYAYLFVTDKFHCFLTANSFANAGDTIGNAMDRFMQSIVSKWGIAGR